MTLRQDIAWRLFTSGLSPADAEPSTTIDGDRQLGRQVLEMVSVLARSPR